MPASKTEVVRSIRTSGANKKENQMKIRSRVMKIAMQLEEELQRQEARQKEILAEGKQRSNPKIERTSVKISWIDYNSGHMLGVPMNCHVSTWVDLE